ncbi:MAG: 2'-5' RNA ligase [Candidatus Portnoybacteria bacterium RBG_13_41_18]|uniref:RNA 2',3'-cyclic phosphodiesterase n=1 Tax=Candidatus Portnoybacteria bacterium RBG_13_41_18 TaxID=1801991 RepID=A0A1G2F9R4_9BACT|nr:MAG: 2'-5' RNA ligase [Candidatus Portnoybacteria bacterium RBG_13_41_18]
MKKRIFIAINLPENIKRRLVEFKEKWDGLFTRHSLGGGGPVRWTKKDSLHLTLVFIGYASDEEMYEVCKITRGIAQKQEPFSLNFDKIIYGPPIRQAQGRPYQPPRMIWLYGRPSQELVWVKTKLEDALSELSGLSQFRPERRYLTPHVTLARMKMGLRQGPAELPKIEQDFKFGFNVEIIDVMESDLRSDGAEYTVLEECPLGN